MQPTIKDQILDELYFLNERRNGGLSYDQLATRLKLNEPSVRRAARQLIVENAVHYTNYEPVTLAYGPRW